MATEVTVPVLGESITEATLGEWLKQPGDPVAVDEPIASLETDKVSVEVPSPVAGVMGQHAVAVGDTVQVGDLTLDVYLTPGHTPGHVIFHHAPSRFALVGDVLFQGSIGRTDFPLGSFDDLVTSVTQKLWPLGDVTFIPGHGQPSTFGHERRTNPFVGDAALAR